MIRGLFYSLLGLGLLGPAIGTSAEVPSAPNGIPFPEGYKDWRVLASSHREDNHTLRVILGNDIAIRAARSGQTNPWPDGAILGKLVWKDASHERWPTATIPGRFVHAEFMFRDAKKWAATKGWGWARWVGTGQKPYGKDAGFSQECVNCHLPMRDNDYVWTKPSVIP